LQQHAFNQLKIHHRLLPVCVCVQFSAIASGGILFALFSAPFWFAGYQLAGQALGGALTRERFAIGRKRWRLAQVGVGQA
jgi:hypothetical protein